MTNTELGFAIQQKTPTLIDKTNPVMVKIPNHGLVNGDVVRATNFFTSPPQAYTGMQELNNNLYTIGNVTTNTFELFDQYGNPIDGTSYTTFVNIGLAQFTLTGPDLYTENLNTQQV